MAYTPEFQRERERENFILTRWKAEEATKRTHRESARLFEKWKKQTAQEGDFYPGWAGKVT